MNVAFLSLGGNLGNRLGYIQQAQNEIEAYCGTILGFSSIYETEPWGHSSSQSYLNQVIKIETPFQPLELLQRTLNIEKKLGRIRKGGEILNRTIDIDILLYNQMTIRSSKLQIPHPRLHLRNFVLKPLNEIDPKLQHSELKLSVKKLLQQCKDNSDVKFYKSNSSPFFISIEGNIGSGKTTIAKALAKKLNADFLPESFENNKLLPLFYAHPTKYAFLLEYSFLLSRFEQLQVNALNQAKTTVSDYSFYKSLWFAKANLKASDFSIFEKQFYKLLENVKQPDIIIYLKTATPNLQKNILNRGRPYENDIQDNYLKKISNNYSKGISELRQKNVLHIEVESYAPGLEKRLLKRIENYLKESFGWHN